VAEKTLQSLKRLRRYLHSAGRYGASPFLVGHYGGAGEIAQGFCRTSAVNGGVYILGKQVSSIIQLAELAPPYERGKESSPPPNFVLTLNDFPDPLTCGLIISSGDYLALVHGATSVARLPSPSDTMIARCIAILDQPISFTRPTEVPVSDPASGVLPKDPYPKSFDTSVLIFPPSSLCEGSSASVSVLITGEESMSAPKGKCIFKPSWISSGV
jgi:hypothetical protein